MMFDTQFLVMLTIIFLLCASLSVFIAVKTATDNAKKGYVYDLNLLTEPYPYPSEPPKTK